MKQQRGLQAARSSSNAHLDRSSPHANSPPKRCRREAMAVRRGVDALPSQVLERAPRPDDKHIRTPVQEENGTATRGMAPSCSPLSPHRRPSAPGTGTPPPRRWPAPPLVVGSSTTEMAEGSSAQHYSLSWNPHLLQRSWRHLHPWRDANVWAQVHLSLVTTVCGLHGPRGGRR